MWIAKPLSALTVEEARDWRRILGHHRGSDPNVPLAQTWTWARGAEVLGMGAWCVYSPDQQVGGVVIGERGSGRFECVNGPWIAWGDPTLAPAQLATFAQAVSRLGPGFRELGLSPRWMDHQAAGFLKGLPVEPASVDRAATRVLRLARTDDEQIDGFGTRLRRTLRVSMAKAMEADCVALDAGLARVFSHEGERYAKERGFLVPGAAWFEALIDSAGEEAGLSLWLARAKVGEPGRWREAQVVVALWGRGAHYLFGWQREEGAPPSAWSAAAVAQFLAMRRCAGEGAAHYDLNGDIVDESPSDPYRGVHEFKAQFGGEVVRYTVPRFVIRAG
ncbi:MAG: hypothetical protein IT285_05990 [Bdellovibrionales bacterium]|nr:hypothetical protein [Bdellovibrionales bacterium]